MERVRANNSNIGEPKVTQANIEEVGMLGKSRQIYYKQRDVLVSLLHLNELITGTAVGEISMLESDCIMDFMNETEGVLDQIIDVTYRLIDLTR